MVRRDDAQHVGDYTHQGARNGEDDVDGMFAAKQRGGLVSRRVEMYEQKDDTTISTRRKGYRSQPQDSFDSPPRRGSIIAYDPQQNSSPVTETRQGPATTYGNRKIASDPQPSKASYIGSTLIERGIAYYRHEEYQKALKAFNTALKTQRVSVGDDDISIALTLGNASTCLFLY